MPPTLLHERLRTRSRPGVEARNDKNRFGIRHKLLRGLKAGMSAGKHRAVLPPDLRN
jgi:hypothetical protein